MNSLVLLFFSCTIILDQEENEISHTVFSQMETGLMNLFYLGDTRQAPTLRAV